MSSEMRELVIRALQSAYAHGEKHAPFALHDCARQIVDAALLARTEAGADGAVAWGSYAKCSASGTPVWNAFVNRKHAEMWASGQWSDGIVYPLTHPQGASGDAERFAFLEKRATQSCAYDVFGNGGHWSIGLHSPDGRMSFREAVDSAMQAKEAK